MSKILKNPTLGTTAVIESTINVQDELAAIREGFRQLEVSFREGLYVQLASVRRFYDCVVQDDGMQAQLKDVLKKANIRVTKNTDLSLQILKYVCSHNRKTLSLYAKSIRASINSDVSADNFFEWIKIQSGVTAFKPGNSNADSKKAETANVLTKKQVTDAFKKSVENVERPIVSTTYETDALPDTFVVGILRVSEHGKLDLLKVYFDKKILETIINAVGKDVWEKGLKTDAKEVSAVSEIIAASIAA